MRTFVTAAGAGTFQNAVAGLSISQQAVSRRIDLDVLTLSSNVNGAVAAIEAGTIDATFHAVPHQLDTVRTMRDGNPHPALAMLLDFLGGQRRSSPGSEENTRARAAARPTPTMAMPTWTPTTYQS